jgi:hypothetical protein
MSVVIKSSVIMLITLLCMAESDSEFVSVKYR